MILKQLSLRGYRNLQELQLDWDAGFNVIWGRNAQGKTNLLEAIYLLGHLKSFRAARGTELIRQGVSAAKLSGHVARGKVSHQLELTLQANGRIPKLDQKSVPRLSHYLGYLRAVLFTPEELAVIRGYPAGRRALLDRAVLQTDPVYLERVQEYEKILRQRNQLLKEQASTAELTPWTAALARTGGRLRYDRLAYVERLRPCLQEVYRQIVQGSEEVAVHYSVTAGSLAEQVARLESDLERLHRRERQLGQSLAGPHRDELDFRIDGQLLKNFGSQGQQRSFLLAFKAAQVIDQKQQLGEAPLLLLDDLASELDRERQAGFVDFLLGQEAQVFITTASPAVLTDAVRRQAGYFHVDRGAVDSLSPE